MDVEFLDAELEVIELPELVTPASGATVAEAAAADFMTWFTDWRRRVAATADVAPEGRMDGVR